MKKLIKTSVCAVAASFAVLACDGNMNVTSCALPKQSASISYDELDLDPSCKSEQKKLVYIHETHPREMDWDYIYSHLPNYVPGSGDIIPNGGKGEPVIGSYGDTNVNGIIMTPDEYEVYKEEYLRKWEEEWGSRKRDLPIPCIVDEWVAIWTALLTDEEIAELEDTYGVFIEDPANPLYSSDSSTGGSTAGAGDTGVDEGCGGL